jgi:hypothetical protein
MTVESSIQTNSLPWQLRQWGKNLSEWIQLQLSTEPPLQESRPSFELPAWMGSLLFWALITGVIAWLAWLMVRSVDRYLDHRQHRSTPWNHVDVITPAEDLSGHAWLRRAQQCERDGDWHEACRAFYMAALQLLHDRDWMPHQVSRTDGEYLAGLRALPTPRPWQLLIRTHERSLFGGEPVGADNVQRCRRAYEEIDQR